MQISFKFLKSDLFSMSHFTFSDLHCVRSLLKIHTCTLNVFVVRLARRSTLTNTHIDFKHWFYPCDINEAKKKNKINKR